jgi:small subunit ribosomal protein S1
VEAIVSDVNRDSRRISLSLKDTLPDPWESVLAKYKVGDSVAGKVRNLTDFGAFVEIEEGVDGLVHVSDMSWTRRIKHPSEVLKKGDDVQAIITSIDQENRRISLSIKEFQPNDWQTAGSLQGRGSGPRAHPSHRRHGYEDRLVGAESRGERRVRPRGPGGGRGGGRRGLCRSGGSARRGRRSLRRSGSSGRARRPRAGSRREKEADPQEAERRGARGVIPGAGRFEKRRMMTKAELIERVAVATDVTKKQAEAIVDTVFDSIVRSLKGGEKIELRGFGSFRLRERGARMGRNPKTGVKVAVPAKKIPYFKPGKELKELINR